MARLELDSGCCTSHQLELDGEDVEDVLVVLVDVLADAIEDGLEDGYEDADVLHVVLHALHVLDVDVRDADAVDAVDAVGSDVVVALGRDGLP